MVFCNVMFLDEDVKKIRVIIDNVDVSGDCIFLGFFDGFVVDE